MHVHVTICYLTILLQRALQSPEERAREQAREAYRKASLSRQRNRLRRALVSDKDFDASSGMDSSVFAAVQKIKESTTSRRTSSDNTNQAGAESVSVETTTSADSVAHGGGDHGEEEEKVALDGFSYDDPSTWDDETRKSWDKFVKKSKVMDSEWWDSENVDTGLPKIWVDLDKE